MDEFQRIIFHVDLDCFFASVEMLDHPEFQGVPLIVGANPKKGKGRGVISTCSYEARDFGLHSGMPISKAYQLCPHGIYIAPHFQRYSAISHKVMEILQSKSEIFEQAGIDEAYIDCTQVAPDFNHAKILAHQILMQVQKETGVTCSIGIAPTKTLAKIGSDCNKPNGITVITPSTIEEILTPLPIRRIPGIGKKTAKYYIDTGCQYIGDFYRFSRPELIGAFGDSGLWIYNIIHGIETRSVGGKHGERKSISKERTFPNDTTDFAIIWEKIEELNQKIHAHLETKRIAYRTISVKIRFHGFETYLRSQSLQNLTINIFRAQQLVKTLLLPFTLTQEKTITFRKPVRLIGLKFSQLVLLPKESHNTILPYVKFHTHPQNQKTYASKIRFVKPRQEIQSISNSHEMQKDRHKALNNLIPNLVIKKND